MKVLIAGDYAPIGKVGELFAQGRYEGLAPVKELIGLADYAIVNLESPVAKDGDTPIDKFGPALKCNAAGVKALAWAGFDCATLANNHFKDYGEKGVKSTLDILKESRIDSVGGGTNFEEASSTLYKQVGDSTLAVINCCESEFSIATSKSGGSNPLNPIAQYYDIKEAKTHADYVLVIVHGGHEGYQLPSPRMQQTYRFLIDAGADAVANSHQHCYSGFETYQGKPILYGLGNFLFETIFASSQEKWHEGYIVMIDFDADDTKFKIYPYRQSIADRAIEMLSADAFNGKIKELNEIISDKNKLETAYRGLCSERTKSTLADALAPYGGRYFLAAAKRRLMPLFISKKRLVRVGNMIRCESHRDLLLAAINNYLTK